MGLLAYAASSTISGVNQRLQLSAVQARTLECAGDKTSRVVRILSGDAILRPSRVYRLLSTLPDEALILVLAKGLTKKTTAGRVTKRLTRFLTRDRYVTTTINGDTLKHFGLQPGPHFKTMLNGFLEERLDDRITAAAQERDRARALAERYR
mgnify:FL=1